MHHHHRHVGPAQHFQHVHRIDLVGHDFRAPHQYVERQRLAAEQRGHDVARLDDADNVLHRSAPDRQTGVRRFQQLGANRRLVGGQVDPVDVHALRHHLAHRPVGQAHDARNDRPLAFLDHARPARLGDDQVQLLGGDVILRFAVQPQQLEDQRARPVEHPHQRRGQLRQPQHRRRHQHRDRLGRAQRELLGHQLAHDQRRIGGQADDQRESRIFRQVGRHAQPLQPLAHRPAQAGARIGARDDADQGDADLHGGQEPARIRRQLQRDPGAAAPGLLHRLQPWPPRRHDGELGHGEDAIERNQRQNDDDVDPGKGRRGWGGDRGHGGQLLPIAPILSISQHRHHRQFSSLVEQRPRLGHWGAMRSFAGG